MDGLITVGTGQRIGIFAGSGMRKSPLMGLPGIQKQTWDAALSGGSCHFQQVNYVTCPNVNIIPEMTHMIGAISNFMPLKKNGRTSFI